MDSFFEHNYLTNNNTVFANFDREKFSLFFGIGIYLDNVTLKITDGKPYVMYDTIMTKSQLSEKFENIPFEDIVFPDYITIQSNKDDSHLDILQEMTYTAKIKNNNSYQNKSTERLLYGMPYDINSFNEDTFALDLNNLYKFVSTLVRKTEEEIISIIEPLILNLDNTKITIDIYDDIVMEITINTKKIRSGFDDLYKSKMKLYFHKKNNETIEGYKTEKFIYNYNTHLLQFYDDKESYHTEITSKNSSTNDCYINFTFVKTLPAQTHKVTFIDEMDNSVISEVIIYDGGSVDVPDMTPIPDDMIELGYYRTQWNIKSGKTNPSWISENKVKDIKSDVIVELGFYRKSYNVTFYHGYNYGNSVRVYHKDSYIDYLDKITITEYSDYIFKEWDLKDTIITQDVDVHAIWEEKPYEAPPELLTKNESKNDMFPLPVSLMEAFYAGVAYKIACSIGDINLINTTAQRYMSEKEKAKMEGFDISSNLNSTLQFKKGFY